MKIRKNEYPTSNNLSSVALCEGRIQHRTSNELTIPPDGGTTSKGKILIRGTVKGFVKRVKKSEGSRSNIDVRYFYRRVVAPAVLFSQGRASGYDGAVVCSSVVYLGYTGKVFGLSV